MAAPGRKRTSLAVATGLYQCALLASERAPIGKWKNSQRVPRLSPIHCSAVVRAAANRYIWQLSEYDGKRRSTG